MRLPWLELEVSYLCWSEEKLNHVLKTGGDKLFKDLLINKTFSKEILSWNFKMEFCLNRGLVWKFLNWKLIIVIAFFFNYNSLNSAAILSPDKIAVGQVGVKNSKIDGS